MQAPRDRSRPLGVVYTPSHVARPMVEHALAPLVAGRTAAEIGALRVCDPAIGEGAFLVEVVHVLAAHLVHAWRAESVVGSDADARVVAARCIVGVDIDADAVASARALAGGGELRVANALELDWPAAFPDVFARGGFDVVIGNPPYIRQERVVDKAALRGFASYDGVADLYVYFIELAHRITRPRGRYCLITPNKWLTAAYGRALRELLASHGSVEGVIDLARARTPLFAEADAFPSIVWGTIGEPQTTPIQAARIAPEVSVSDALRDTKTPHARTAWRGDPWHIDVPSDRTLIERLERTWPALRTVLAGRPARGVVTGCNRAFVIDRAVRDRLLATEPGAADLVRPFVKGRDLRRWVPNVAERWLLLVDRGTRLADHPALLAHLQEHRTALEPRPASWQGAWPGRKPGAYRWYELQDPVGQLAASRTPRLLYQDIQTGPACCVDDSGLVPDTTVWILPTADRVVLAILNSSLYFWYARRRFPPALNGAVRPKLAYMGALPIATPSSSARAAIERLVETRIDVEAMRRAGDAIAARTARELDHTLDVAVLDLYELSGRERSQIGEDQGTSGIRITRR